MNVRSGKTTTQAETPKVAIATLVNRALTTRQITRADQQRFIMAALSTDQMAMEERRQVNRVFDELQRGCIRVVD